MGKILSLKLISLYGIKTAPEASLGLGSSLTTQDRTNYVKSAIQMRRFACISKPRTGELARTLIIQAVAIRTVITH